MVLTYSQSHRFLLLYLSAFIGYGDFYSHVLVCLFAQGQKVYGSIYFILKPQYNGYVQNAIKTLSIVALIILTCTMTYVFLPFTDITIVQDWYIEKMKFMPPQGTAVISFCILIVLGTVLAFIFFVFGNTMRQFIPENCKE